MKRPNVGDEYERNGKVRIVTRVEDRGGRMFGPYSVWWRTPGGVERKNSTWCSTWLDWVAKAKLMQQGGDRD